MTLPPPATSTTAPAPSASVMALSSLTRTFTTTTTTTVTVTTLARSVSVSVSVSAAIQRLFVLLQNLPVVILLLSSIIAIVVTIVVVASSLESCCHYQRRQYNNNNNNSRRGRRSLQQQQQQQEQRSDSCREDHHELHDHERNFEDQTDDGNDEYNDGDDTYHHRHRRGRRRRRRRQQQQRQERNGPWVNQNLMAVLAFLSRSSPFSSSSSSATSSFEDDRPTMSVLDEEIDSDNDNDNNDNQNEKEEGEDFIDDDDWLEICKYYKNVITVAFDGDNNIINNNSDGLFLLRRGRSQRNRILRIHYSLQPDEPFIEWKTKHHRTVVNVGVGTTKYDHVDEDDFKCCCPVCLIDFQDHDMVTTPLFQKCSCCTRQVFHRSCIAQWLMVEASSADPDGINDHGTAAAGNGGDTRTGRSISSRRSRINDYRYCNSTCPCCRQTILLSDEEFVQAHHQWLNNNMKRRSGGKEMR